MPCKTPSNANELSTSKQSLTKDQIKACDNSSVSYKKTPYRVGLTGGIA